MEKMFVFQRISECDTVNKNGVVYSKEEFNKAMIKAFERYPDGIPVTYGDKIYQTSLTNPGDICTVRLDTIVGAVRNMEGVRDKQIEVTPSIVEKSDILNDLCFNNCRIGIRYISRVNIKNKSFKEVKDMNIIAFDLLNEDQYCGSHDWW